MIKYHKKVFIVFAYQYILIDSVFKMAKNYYPHVFLEECKYIVKEKEVTRHITEDLEVSVYDSDESDEK